MNRRRLLRRLLAGSTHNVSFSDFQNLIEGFGFELARITGSHFTYFHPSIQDRINIQPVRGEAKPYQLRQFLDLVEEYNLSLEDQA
jgi:predicted RNA binding protein YcfA (HicA-like mRNA interferase family)